MRDDLRTAYWMKERAELLLSNLDKLKAEGTITKAEYETLKPEYIAMLDDALPLIKSIKAYLQKELGGEEKELERLEKQLSLLRARLKVSEISSETYREKGKPLEEKVKQLESQISQLQKLIGATSSADIGGPKASGAIVVKHAKLRTLITAVISVCLVGLVTWGLVALFSGPACPKIGDRAPDFTLKTIEGKEMRLSDFRGKIVMVYLWSICPPCVDDMPYIQSVFDKWEGQNLTVLAINLLNTPEAIEDFIADENLTVPIFLDLEQETIKRYCLERYVPVTIFINRNGIVEEVRVGGWAYQNQDDTQKIISEIGSILNETDHSQKFDWTPPIFSNISVSSITESSAIISWQTDEPSTSQVSISGPEYSTWTELDETLVTSHSVSLTDLDPNTNYEYLVMSCDVQENIDWSEFQSFTTRGTGSVTAETGPEIGKRAPNFTLNTTGGGSVSLSDFRGRKVMLNFWSSSCSACVIEIPHIQEVFNKWSEDGLVILAVSVREDPAKVSSFAMSERIRFPVLLDSEGVVDQLYNFPDFPTTFFIDDKGVIRAIKEGAFNSQQEIENMLRSL